MLAQNVRILEIQSSEAHGHYREGAKVDDQVIPAIFPDLEVPPAPGLDTVGDVETLRKRYAAKNAMDLDAERILVSALKGMSGLTSFRWSRTPPLINRNREDDVWITLANYCPSLIAIDVIDREKPYKTLLELSDDPAYQRPSRNPNVCHINSVLLPTVTLINAPSVLFIQKFEIIFIPNTGLKCW